MREPLLLPVSLLRTIAECLGPSGARTVVVDSLRVRRSTGFGVLVHRMFGLTVQLQVLNAIPWSTQNCPHG